MSRIIEWDRTCGYCGWATNYGDNDKYPNQKAKQEDRYSSAATSFGGWG